MEKYICNGCGVELSKDEDNKGYTPIEISETSYCQRCHKLKHYNKLDDHGLDNSFYMEEIKKMAKKNALFVYVLDILDVKSSNIKEIFELIKNKDYVVLFNRVDLLPIQKSERKIAMHCVQQLKENNLKPVDFLAVSAIKNRNIDDCIDMLQQYAKEKEIVFVGTSNIGKSSLLKAITKTCEAEKEILVSNFPGTTLACIKHVIEPGFEIWDTPGVINEGVVSTHFKKTQINKLKNIKEIKPATYQLNPDQTIYLGGLAKFRYTDGEKCGFAFVMPPNILVHRTKTVQEEKIDPQLESLKLTPVIEGKKKVHKFTITGTRKQMIVIGGLGFIALKPNKQVVEVETNENVKVYVTESIL